MRDGEPARRRMRQTCMPRLSLVTAGLGAAVLLALLLLVLFVAPGDPGVPCVDYIPANISCAADSPAVVSGR